MLYIPYLAYLSTFHSSSCHTCRLPCLQSGKSITCVSFDNGKNQVLLGTKQNNLKNVTFNLCVCLFQTVRSGKPPRVCRGCLTKRCNMPAKMLPPRHVTRSCALHANKQRKIKTNYYPHNTPITNYYTYRINSNFISVILNAQCSEQY